MKVAVREVTRYPRSMMTAQRLQFIVVLLSAWAARSTLDDTCASHEAGRNCSDISMLADAMAGRGCAGAHLSYMGAALSAVSYLEWDRVLLGDSLLPSTVPFEFGPCMEVKAPGLSRKPRLHIWSAMWTALVAGPSTALSAVMGPFLPTLLQLRNRVMSSTLSIIRLLNRIFNVYMGRDAVENPRILQKKYGVRQVTVSPVWFFSDWKDGLWHDTEVLIATSPTTAFVIFRGSDSPADAATSSQTYVPARRVNYFPSLAAGSLHRGILNAYSQVSSGRIIYLSDASGNWEDKSPFLKVFHNAFAMCLGDANRTLTADTDPSALRSRFFKGAKCQAKNSKLSSVLSAAVLAGIENDMKVVVYGHSLGGGLATLLAIDVLMNTLTAPAEHDLLQESDDTSLDWIYDSSVALTGVTASPSSNLFLLTYGDPEVADSTFFDNLFFLSPRVKRFSIYNHYRFVSVSRYPACKMDVVTGSLTYANGLFGDLLMGKGGGIWGRIQARAESRLARKSREGEAVDNGFLRTFESHSLVKKADTPSSHFSRLADNLGELSVAPVSEGLLERHGYLKTPVYVSSGHAASQFAAHSLIHYIQGLTRALNQNRKVTCDFEYVKRSYGTSLREEPTNVTADAELNCARCYMGAGLPVVVADEVLYSSGGCRRKDDANRLFTLMC